jgi:hypothetical protein
VCFQVVGRLDEQRGRGLLDRGPQAEHFPPWFRTAIIISWLRVFRSVDIARLGSGRRPQHHMRRGEEKNAWNSEPERGAGMR